MLQAYPRSPDPVADWSEAWWNNLLRTVEGGEGLSALLRRLFTDHFDAARKKLAPANSCAEDLLLDLDAARESRARRSSGCRNSSRRQADSPRQNELKLREGELQMYLSRRPQAGGEDLHRAGRLATSTASAPRSASAIWPSSRATSTRRPAYYADVQNRARARAMPRPRLGGLVANQLVKGGPGAAPGARPDWRSSPLALHNARPEAAWRAPDQRRRASGGLAFGKCAHAHRGRISSSKRARRCCTWETRISAEQDQRRLHPPRIRALHEDGGLEARPADARSLLPRDRCLQLPARCRLHAHRLRQGREGAARLHPRDHRESEGPAEISSRREPSWTASSPPPK